MREVLCMGQAHRNCHELWANHGNQGGNLDDIRICQSGDVARVDRSAGDLDRYAVLGLLFAGPAIWRICAERQQSA